MPQTLLITGTLGVGKTATASAISSLLRLRGTPHALVDLDALRSCSLPSDTDADTLCLQNLASISTNYRAAGADVIVLATTVESRDMVRRLAEASGVDEGDMAVVRLVAPTEIVQKRLVARDGEESAWRRRRVEELAGVMEAAELPGAVVSADAPLVDVAARALRELEEL